MTEAVNEQLIAVFEAAEIDAAGQASVLEVLRAIEVNLRAWSHRRPRAVCWPQAAQFLLRQAAKTAEAKRTERLKPMGCAV